MTSKQNYISAYDPIVKERVVHKVIKGWAISLLSGHKFRYDASGIRKNSKEENTHVELKDYSPFCYSSKVHGPRCVVCNAHLHSHPMTTCDSRQHYNSYHRYLEQHRKRMKEYYKAKHLGRD
jgi:hypothetical protein